MEKNKIIIVVCLLIVIAAVAGWYFRSQSGAPVEIPKDQIMTEEMQLQQDREALKSSNSTPNQIYGAMIRLAQKKEDIARDEAVKRSKDENPFLRGGAAQALGHFDDEESKAALKELLNDKEKSVRLFAIQGLGAKTDNLREQELQQLLKSSDLDPRMEVEIYSSLIKAGDEATVQNAITNLIRIAKEGDDDVNTEAAQRLVTQAPDNALVLDLLRRKISAAKNERLTAVGTRYLSSRNDPWIRPILKTLSSHSSAIVRSAVVQSLHRVCPDDRWDILNKMLEKESDPSVLKLIIEEPMYLMGGKAREFAKKAASIPNLPADAKKVADETIAKVSSGSEEELCSMQKNH